MLDVCGPSCEFRDAWKMPALVMCLFEELCSMHCGKEGTWMVGTVGRPLLWAGAGH